MAHQRDEPPTPIRTVAPRRGKAPSRSGSHVRVDAEVEDDESDEDPLFHRGRENSTQLLMDALTETAADSKARQALLLLADHLLNSRGEAKPEPSRFTPELFRRWALAGVLMLGVAAPIVEQIAAVAGEYFRPNQVVLKRLDEIDANVRQMQTLQRESIAWTIDSFKAQRDGLPLPDVPPSMKLAAAQSEVEKNQ